MATISFAAPILPGKLEAWRRFNQETLGSRFKEYQASRQRLGITKELSWLQQTPAGDLAIVYIELKDPERLFGEIARSTDPFNVWFRQQVLEIHGLDLAQPSDEPPPQLEFEWQAA
jgi:hypothetical protein